MPVFGGDNLLVYETLNCINALNNLAYLSVPRELLSEHSASLFTSNNL